MARLTSVALCVAALGVAGCGASTSTSASTAPTTAPSTEPSTTVAASTSTVTATTAPTTSAPATTAPATTSPPTTGTGRCTAPDLTAALQQPGSGAAGTIYYTIKATNISAAPCVTGGYFGVSDYDVAGQAISTQDGRILGGEVNQFTLAAGSSLTFSVGLSDVPTGTQASCPQVGALHLIPPNDTRFVQLSLLNSSGQGARIVNCTGTLAVSPAVPT